MVLIMAMYSLLSSSALSSLAVLRPSFRPAVYLIPCDSQHLSVSSTITPYPEEMNVATAMTGSQLSALYQSLIAAE